jgi:hypothetical protein
MRVLVSVLLAIFAAGVVGCGGKVQLPEGAQPLSIRDAKHQIHSEYRTETVYDCERTDSRRVVSCTVEAPRGAMLVGTVYVTADRNHYYFKGDFDPVGGDGSGPFP